MKKKVFIILSSLTSGGTERVFWLISQYLDKNKYNVSIVLLDSKRSFFSHEIKDVQIIDLKSINASKSFFPLLALLKKEKPDAVFSTAGHIAVLVSLVSMFVKVPRLIARGEILPHKTTKSASWYKELFYNVLSPYLYGRFDYVICQSAEMKAFYNQTIKIPLEKLRTISNPVVPTSIHVMEREPNNVKKLIIVARLANQKGHVRLLDVMKSLPDNYELSIAGDGPLRDEIAQKIKDLNLSNRVKMWGVVSNSRELMAEHDLLVLSSFTEGFPNVVVESLSIGLPTVTFDVSGISEIIQNGFNGFIVPQNDLEQFKEKIIESTNTDWDSIAIKNDAFQKFSIDKIVKQYEILIEA